MNTTCPKHPKVETALRCASCNILICPSCLVQTPVGAKCKSCASNKDNQLFKLSPVNILGAALSSFIIGVVTGWGVTFLGFFIFILALMFGPVAGDLILRASGRKRGLKLEILTGVMILAGVIISRLLMAIVVLSAQGQVAPPYGIFQVLIELVIPNPVPFVAVIIVIAGAVGRIRYL